MAKCTRDYVRPVGAARPQAASLNQHFDAIPASNRDVANDEQESPVPTVKR